MDIDGPESGTQNIYQAKDYGVVVDFDELGEDEQEVRFSLPLDSLFFPLLGWRRLIIAREICRTVPGTWRTSSRRSSHGLIVSSTRCRSI